jgi:hypothetical protein
MESLDHRIARFLGNSEEDGQTDSGRNFWVVLGGDSEGYEDGSGSGFGSAMDGQGSGECGHGSGFNSCGGGYYWTGGAGGRGYMAEDGFDSGFTYAGAGGIDGTGEGYGDHWDLKYSMPDAPTPGIKTIQGRPVHYVDVHPIANNYPLVFEGFRDDFAIVRILRPDISFSPPCYLMRVGDFFALGKEPHLAHELASGRHLDATTPKPKEEIYWNPDDPNDIPF